MPLSPYIEIVAQGAVLSEEQCAAAFSVMMQGDASEDQMARFLTLLAERGESVAEITGAARALRENMIAIRAPQGAIDCCGTGGDGRQTLNISTAVSFVVAASGAPVAKHGNRAATSASGAADVLAALGVQLDLPPARLEDALHEIGFCFLMAPRHHPAMKHVAAVRRNLGRRTLFNLLGPLANPAGVRRQLVGVFAPDWVMPIASALDKLGSERAWVVHGRDGLDEISLNAQTQRARLDGGRIDEDALTPADFGVTPPPTDALRGGDATYNANAIRRLFAGEKSAYRDSVLANSAAALIIAEKAADLHTGMAMAGEAIDSGNALNILQRYIEFSHEAAAA